MLDVRAASQKDQDRLEKWANGNLVKFNKSESKSLLLGWNSLLWQYIFLESSSAERDLGYQLKAEHEPEVCLISKEGLWQHELYQQESSQEVKGSDSSPLFSNNETASGVLCSVLGSPLQERSCHSKVSAAECYQDDNWKKNP